MKKGFSLVELLVYLSLFSFLSLIIMRFIVGSVLHLRHQGSAVEGSINMVAICDSIAHKLAETPCQSSLWKKCNNNEIIWHNDDNTDKSFLFDNSTLWYITGIFDQEKNSWIKKRKQRIGTSIKSCNWSPEYYQSIQGQCIHAIKCTIITDSIYYDRKILLGNRIISYG